MNANMGFGFGFGLGTTFPFTNNGFGFRIGFGGIPVPCDRFNNSSITFEEKTPEKVKQEEKVPKHATHEEKTSENGKQEYQEMNKHKFHFGEGKSKEMKKEKHAFFRFGEKQKDSRGISKSTGFVYLKNPDSPFFRIAQVIDEGIPLTVEHINSIYKSGSKSVRSPRGKRSSPRLYTALFKVRETEEVFSVKGDMDADTAYWNWRKLHNYHPSIHQRMSYVRRKRFYEFIV